MHGNAALKLEDSWDEPATPALVDLTTSPGFAAPETSPVAAMHHQLQQAALRGVFDKAPSRWHSRHRGPIALGMAIVTSAAAYAALAHLAG